MSDDALSGWVRSGRHAQLDGVQALPQKHRLLRDTPVIIQRAQAKALFLSARDGARWILKKFHQGRCLDGDYLRAVGSVLPRHDGFRSGTARKLLAQNDHRQAPGCYYSSDLARWLDGSVLMPRISGCDWAALADDLRDQSVQLDKSQRVTLARNLADLIRQLEQAGCAHRDLSSSNVFLDVKTWSVSLIDFDSTYHASLAMPRATTCGTEGYTPAFVWISGRPDPTTTWCSHADRYAMALLIVEFLITDRNTTQGAEGGAFHQDELRSRSGNTLRRAVDQLRGDFAPVIPLFETVIKSRRCSECPAPDDWLQLFDRIVGPPIKPPPLDTIEQAKREDFESILRRRRPAAPIWPAPNLKDVPVEPFGPLPPRPLKPPAPPIVPLPADPWATRAPSPSAKEGQPWP